MVNTASNINNSFSVLKTTKYNNKTKNTAIVRTIVKCFLIISFASKLINTFTGLNYTNTWRHKGTVFLSFVLFLRALLDVFYHPFHNTTIQLFRQRKRRRQNRPLFSSRTWSHSCIFFDFTKVTAPWSVVSNSKTQFPF